MQTGYRPIAGTRGFELLSADAVAEAARGAARQAITKLDARPAPSGDLPVVLAGGSGGILFHEACGHGLEADAILKQASVYAGKVGQLVASPLVTLVDDGTVEGEWGYLAIDDEGRPGARNVLIENGVLTDYMWDYLRSRKEGRASSGNGRRQSYQHLPMVRMTNTYLLEGDADADEIVAQTPYGVYVAQLGGGQVNTATGDFVFGMTAAFMIEDGKITAPLRDCNLIGNGPGRPAARRRRRVGLLDDAGHLRQERPERARRHRSGDDAPHGRHDRRGGRVSQLLERAQRILESARGRRGDRGLRRQRRRYRGPVLPGRDRRAHDRHVERLRHPDPERRAPAAHAWARRGPARSTTRRSRTRCARRATT